MIIKNKPFNVIQDSMFSTVDFCTVKMLRVDQLYQRGVVSLKNSRSIATDFSWQAFGALTVGYRNDNSYHIVDGQQRFNAVKMRNDYGLKAQNESISYIDKVPCLVFQSSGPDHEARVFRNINMCRKPVRALDRWKSALTGKTEPETEINHWLTYGENGAGFMSTLGFPSFSVVAKSTQRDQLKFTSLIIYTWKIDSEATKRALMSQATLMRDNEPLSEILHRGLFNLYRNRTKNKLDICSPQFINAIQNAGGGSACLTLARDRAKKAEKNPSNELTSAEALVITYKQGVKRFNSKHTNGNNGDSKDLPVEISIEEPDIYLGMN
jgi:hypothetical protein